MSSLIQNYIKAKEELYQHVGFVEDQEVKYAVVDLTHCYWSIEEDYVRICNTIAEYASGIRYGHPIHQSDLIKYRQGVFPGENLNLIICDTENDDEPRLFMFDNTKYQQRNQTYRYAVFLDRNNKLVAEFIGKELASVAKERLNLRNKKWNEILAIDHQHAVAMTIDMRSK